MKLEELLDKDGYLAYTIKGISMMPLLHQDRDVVIIRKLNELPLKRFDIVLFKRTKRNEYVLHRILKCLPDDRYWIVGDNCISGDIVDGEDILGILTQIKNGGRRSDPKNLSYQLYINTWCRFYHLRFAILKFRSFLSRAVHKILSVFA